MLAFLSFLQMTFLREGGCPLKMDPSHISYEQKYDKNFYWTHSVSDFLYPKTFGKMMQSNWRGIKDINYIYIAPSISLSRVGEKTQA